MTRAKIAGAFFCGLGLAFSLAGPARATEYIVGPGSSGTILIEITNDADSVGDIEGARLTFGIDNPQYASEFGNHFLVDANNSVLGPLTIPVGQSRTFSLKYIIGSNAPEGSFNLVLLTTTTTDGVLPEIGTFDVNSNIIDASVLFTTKPVPFSLEKSV